MAYAGGTVVNPTIPYACPIPGGLPDGKMIIVKGICDHHQDAFSINLSANPQMSPLRDTVLHFNVRFNENAIVRNCQQGVAWGLEERGRGMPLRKGTPFEIIILAHRTHYKISVDGRHFANFRHRFPKESAQYLVIIGEINVSYVKFEGGATPSSPANSDAQPMYNPPVPFTTSIPGGIYPGRILNISGIPNPDPTRFTVNLMCGQSRQADIGLHLDVRFNHLGDCNQTVRNHRVSNAWGTEETHQNYFPFVPKAEFNMTILIEQAEIKVAVNNQHFFEFNHRIQPLSRVDFLNVEGDVLLTSVKIQ
ncbi:galectin-4-like [Haliotis rubra]|uniref:galectin-4-like n=1 Tax=Haliotis rubra TaxID=36100 RepID=UPI001EE63491|nr:galectin-4-like [Haliotis rubra]